MLKNTILGIAFLLELAALAALGYWGFHYTSTTWIHWLAGIGAPLLVALFWSRRMAPLAPNRFEGARYIIIKLVIFEVASAALYASGKSMLGIVFAIFSLTFIIIEALVA